MKPLTIVVGFIPQAIFVILVSWLSLGWAAAAGLAAGVILVAVSATRGGVKILPVAQSVILAAFTVVGFTVGHQAEITFAPYARGVASLALGAFIVATSSSFPFTAQFARQTVPQQYWQTPQFLSINRRVSLVWGLAVLAIGAGHLGAAFAGSSAPIVRILLDWGVPAYAAFHAYTITKHTIGQNGHTPHPGETGEPADQPAH